MTPHLGLQRIMIPSSQVSSLTTGSIALPSGKGNFYDGAYGSYDALASITVPSGGLASIVFAGIPTGYKHLQIRTLVRNTSTSNGYTARFNGDSSSNYTRHYFIGTGTNPPVGVSGGLSTSVIINDATISTSITNAFGISVCDILDYASTNKNKTVRTLGGFDNNGSGSVGLLSGLWMSTSAISNIRITPDAGNFAEFSQFSLYGVK
jgi:hypothetical protein